MTILLLGGTGRTSTRIARLLTQSSTPYILASRSSQTCHFDWLDAATYTHPFSQDSTITTVYLIAPAVTDVFALMKNFIDLAREKGVKRFVLLSASAIEAGGPAYGTVHKYLMDLGVEWAVPRPSWFMENFSESQHRNSIREEGKVYSAAEDGKVPWISVEDIARVGMKALLGEPAWNRDEVLLGPELLTYDDIAAILSDVLGRKITHVKISQPELAERMQAQGLPANYANMLSSMDTLISKGSEASLNDTVKRITGTSPMTFRDFAEANKGCWV